VQVTKRQQRGLQPQRQRPHPRDRHPVLPAAHHQDPQPQQKPG